MSEPTNSTWKIEFPPFDLRALLRLAIWGCAASGALMVAVISAPLDRGIAPRGRGGATRRCANPRDHGPAGYAGRRHGERDPTAVRDGAGAHRRSRPPVGARRIARAQPRGRHELDQAAGRRRAWPAYPALSAITAAPAAPAPQATVGEPVVPQPTAARPPAEPQTARVADAPAVKAAEAEATAAATEFGVDVGGAVNFDGLRVLWNSTRNANAALFEGLHPVVAAQICGSSSARWRAPKRPREPARRCWRHAGSVR